MTARSEAFAFKTEVASSMEIMENININVLFAVITLINVMFSTVKTMLTILI